MYTVEVKQKNMRQKRFNCKEIETLERNRYDKIDYGK